MPPGDRLVQRGYIITEISVVIFQNTQRMYDHRDIIVVIFQNTLRMNDHREISRNISEYREYV